jgi:uncharacterized membrane protein
VIDSLRLLILLITTAGGLAMVAAGVSCARMLVRSRFSDLGLDRMRRRLAGGIVGALGLMSAATLLKTLTLQNWSAVGLFALVVVLRLLIKRSLAAHMTSTEPR